MDRLQVAAGDASRLLTQREVVSAGGLLLVFVVTR